ncbi:MAG: 2-C-methyl-D-erythritol 2,4-cyclodiphosphate synthase, partial [Burkholderiales bacterium]|nr:2-C-methyl-D-erythritol 2,4-cyclodiphosphate synthase [Burkholderiales bacterium]
MFRIGQGFDLHRLVAGRKLILGGIEIPYDYGLAGHSDADVLIHAIIDALIGAVALGDIGKLFPDNDSKFKDIDSKILLKKVYQQISELGYQINNIDSTII